MLERLLLALDRHPRICQALLAALLATAIAFLHQLRIDDSPERWLPASTHEAWRVLDEHFNFGDTVAVGFEFKRPIRDDDAPALAWFREQLAAIPGMRQVYDAAFVAENIEGVPLTELLDPANSKRFHLYEGALFSPPDPKTQHQTLLTACELKYPRDLAELRELRRGVIDSTYQIVAEAKQKPEFRDVRFHLAGGILLADDLEQKARTAAMLFLPLSMIVAIVTLLVGFRSLRALLIAVAGAISAMLLVVGYVAWSGSGLGALTISAPTLISIIAIATTIHFANDAAEHPNAVDSPAERDRLVRWIAVPCLGVAILTGTGFLMLLFNELTPVRALGLELAAGSLAAFFCVFIFLRVLPIRRAYAGQILTPERFAHLADFLKRNAGTITTTLLTAMVIFTLLAWPWSPTAPVGLKVDVDPFSFFGPENHLVQARQHFLETGFGLYQLEVTLVPKEAQPTSPETDAQKEEQQRRLAEVQKFSDLMIAQTDLGVLGVISTQAMRDRQAKFYEDLLRTSEGENSFAAAAKKIAQVAKLTKYSQTFNETFENWNRDKLNQGAIRLTFLAKDKKPGGFAELYQLAEKSMPADYNGYISGTITSVVQLSDGLVNGVAWGLSVSIVIMALVCAVLFKSWRLAAIAAVLNAFPITIVYGYMGLVGVPLSSGSAMVATVSLGMNQTIYIMMRYRKLTREEGYETASAIRETYYHIGRPVVLTCIVFTAGFLIFLVSDFMPLYHFGLLTSIAMLAGLLGDIVFLQCLLHTFDKRPGDTMQSAKRLAA